MGQDRQPARGARRLALAAGPRAGVAAAALAGAVVFVLRFGVRVVWPLNSAWQLASPDTAMPWLAWRFWRGEPWTLPLGHVSGYMAPGGTTIALTDSLPVLALPAKLLGFLLPAGFQFFGGWLLLSHVLQAVFAWLLARRLPLATAGRAAAAALLFLSPAFLDRHVHISLSAHWQLLAAFWLYLQPTGDRPARRVAAWAGLTLVACLTHTYLGVMVMALGAAWAVREAGLERTLRPAPAVGTLALMAALALGCWFGVGFLEAGNVAGSSSSIYGRSYLNLDFAWNGLGRTLILPARSIAIANDIESFNALGAGLLLLAAGAAALLVLRRTPRPRWRRHLPLAVVLAGCLLFALGGRLVLDDRPLAAWTLPGWFAALAAPFRASARFVWPVHYGLVLAALAVWSRLPRRRLAAGALVVLAALQTVDLLPVLDQRAVYAAKRWTTRLQSPEWDRALDGADALWTYPPQMKHTCVESDFVDLCELALRHGIPTSAGYSARLFQSAREGGVERLQELLQVHADPRGVYVLRRSYFAASYPELRDRFVCTDLDGFPVCFARDGGYRPERAYRVFASGLAEVLDRTGGATVVLAAKGDITARLAAGDGQALAARGTNLGALPAGGAYVAVLAGGRPLFEQMDPTRPIHVEGSRGQGFGPLRLACDLTVDSGGADDDAPASLRLDGREVLFNLDGLNYAVLGPDQQVLAVGVCARPDGGPPLVYTLQEP